MNLKIFRETLLQRGARGIFGLRRNFQILDDDGSRTLEWAEFWKGVTDFRVKIDEVSA